MDDDLEKPNDKKNNNHHSTEEEIDKLLANYNYSSDDESHEYECAADIYRHPSYNGGKFNFYRSDVDDDEEDENSPNISMSSLNSSFRSFPSSRSNSPPPTKKFKLDDSMQPNYDRCKICKNIVDESTPRFDEEKFKSDYADTIKEERDAARDERVSIMAVGEEEHQTWIMDDFSIYDKEHHLINLESKLIESKNVQLKISGTVKGVDEKTKIPILDAGPIDSWWITGYPSDEEIRICVTTQHAEIYLGVPSTAYEDQFFVLKEKSLATKMIYSMLEQKMNNHELKHFSYEDLVEESVIQAETYGFSDFTEQTLLNYGDFIVQQIESFEKAAAADEDTILESPALKKLCEVSNADSSLIKSRTERTQRLQKRQNRKPDTDVDYICVSSTDSEDDEFEPSISRKNKSGLKKPPPPMATKASTTPLVGHLFETVFSRQMSKSKMTKGCGKCEPCRNPDCGSCSQCLKMVKFHGNVEDDVLICDKRQCYDAEIIFEEKSNKVSNFKRPRKDQIVFGNFIGEEKTKKFYGKVDIRGVQYLLNDHAQVVPTGSSDYFCKIISLFCSSSGEQMAHVRWFACGKDTVLGNVADSKELFAVMECEDILLDTIIQPITVEHCPISLDDWSMMGGTIESIVTPTTHIADQEYVYWYRHFYDPSCARFECIPEILLENDPNGMKCKSCEHLNTKFHNLTPRLDENNDLWFKGKKYVVGDGVMLLPKSFDLAIRQKKGFRKIRREEAKDPKTYTEFWRKQNSGSKGDTQHMNDPFDIGIITSFTKENHGGVKLNVRVLYRPENTQFSWSDVSKCDVNMLFWTDDVQSINATKVEGKCFVLPKSKIEEEYPFIWTNKGSFRFYYQSAYNTVTDEVEESLPEEGLEYEPPNIVDDYPLLDRPMDTMDVFAGCGGLSIGLERSGASRLRWAVENDAAAFASSAYKLNHPECQVIREDVNTVLKEVLSGKSSKVPKKGDVEMLIGGPPCQGFSLLNVFTKNDTSKFKNSLISSFLSVCDYYRPKYFILENVKNFAAFKQGQVLRLCMRALVLMGYQCQFGVLQAGNFGVPQNRKRAFLLAAAPSCKLPQFPAADHTFEKMPLTVLMDEKAFDVNSHWRQFSAPYRNITVRDALNDLDPSAASDKPTKYANPPDSFYQRNIRWDSENFMETVKHHEARVLNPICMERMKLIPKTFGGDWRDLPNIKITLPNGQQTVKLRYPYIDWKTGRPAVCSCRQRKGARCDVRDYQSPQTTLIPWAMAHTANGHNHWSGLYARVHWESYFSTVVTGCHPEGKQGRVIHPEENRILSVREVARAQGFPDSAQFVGGLMDKYRQIGNAVPPPLGRALGISILQAEAKKIDLESKRYDPLA